MMINTASFTQTGKRHLSRGQENQDSIKLFEDERIVISSLSDGASGSECAKPASESTVAACVEFAADSSIWDMSNKALTAELLRTIDKHYLACPCPYDRLTATMVMLVINKVTSQFIAISIGDCSCVMFDRSFGPSLLLRPTNFIKKNRTVFANDPLAKKYMKIQRGSMDSNGVAGFVLMSDGADALIGEESADSLRGLAELTAVSPKEAQTELENVIAELAEHTGDDITAAAMMIADDEELNALAYTDLGFPEEEHSEPVPVEVTALPEPEDSSLLSFLREPRTAEELLKAGYIGSETSLLTVMYPYLRDSLVSYSDRRFVSAGGA